MLRKISLLLCFLSAFASVSAPPNNAIVVRSDELFDVLNYFKAIAIRTTSVSSAKTAECGFIFVDDASKFGCEATGDAAEDIVDACFATGLLACTGSGSQKSCACVFN